MSSAIYPPLTPEEKTSAEQETKWLVKEIILPALPSIRETLHHCMLILDESNNEEYKLPLTSYKSDSVKGIITRKNTQITGFNVVLKNGFKKLNLSLKQDTSIHLPQLKECYRKMCESIEFIDEMLSSYNFSCLSSVDAAAKMGKISDAICMAKQSLLVPSDRYMFPRFRVPAIEFEPKLPENIALDFGIYNNEVTLDFRTVSNVSVRPWSVILNQRDRFSFIDSVRSKITQQRGKPINTIVNEEYVKLVEWMRNSQKGNSNFLHIFSHSSNEMPASLLKQCSKYLETGVTYMDNEGKPRVVTVDESVDVISSDPLLLSIGVKLDSLKNLVLRLDRNLRIAMNESGPNPLE